MSIAENGTWFPPSHDAARNGAHDPSKWECTRCHKTSYESEYRAWQAIGAISRLNRWQGRPDAKKPCRVYACPDNQGFHLTSKYEDKHARGSTGS